MQRHLVLFFASLSAVACADGATTEKPASDPDLALTGKADSLSSYWTDVRGELAIGSQIAESIDYPSYYFGRTVELRAGQRIQVDIESNRSSLVRMYGPSTGTVDGYPVFGSAAVKQDTRKSGGKQKSSFNVTVMTAGTYMLVYGPKYVWAADYKIDVTCLDGCAAADACEDDSECQAGQFCGDNGVRCVRAPCDASYNVCKAKVAGGSSCNRDAECKDGFACREGTCDAQVCSAEGDCDNGFCGCADGSCTTSICKDFAKEGDSCGGFRMAHMVRHCSNDFECVGPHNIIADIPGHCGEMTTVRAVLADPAGFDGRFIAVQGVLDPGAAFCTKLACSPANPCCNQCGANMRLFDDASQLGTGGISLSEDGANLGCGGNECTWADNCAVPGGNYWVAGWFRLDNGVSPRLEITSRYSY